MNYISTLYANRKKDLPNITLRSYYTDKHGATRNRLGSQFRSIFYKTMEREWEQNPLPNLYGILTARRWPDSGETAA